ncbi:MAG: hypothetical protein GY832_02660 [Chloroflexi bacterium]|nr:hypothetical protein [Chloroflexota bacterium]
MSKLHEVESWVALWTAMDIAEGLREPEYPYMQKKEHSGQVPDPGPPPGKLRYWWQRLIGKFREWRTP